MAHHAAKSSQPHSTDFDRQYEEDLERARALSLESLALEKFRLQKLELEKKQTQERRPSQVDGMHHGKWANPLLVFGSFRWITYLSCLFFWTYNDCKRSYTVH